MTKRLLFGGSGLILGLWAFKWGWNVARSPEDLGFTMTATAMLLLFSGSWMVFAGWRQLFLALGAILNGGTVSRAALPEESEEDYY